MHYKDLRDFLSQLEQQQLLHRIQTPISPNLEITEVSRRVLAQEGPALLFENPTGYKIPVLSNLFGTKQRVALALGLDNINQLRDVGLLLAQLKEPTPPKNLKEAWAALPLFKKILDMTPKITKQAPWQNNHLSGNAIHLLDFLPVQTCWPDDVGPLITWGLTITQGVRQARQNMGIYRQQVIGPNRIIMRWLAHRGGALDYQAFCQRYPDKPFPVAVTLGADPASLLAAVTPIPDHISEFAFAGLLRGNKTQVVQLDNGLLVPASSEIVLCGHIYPKDTALEGPFGDHTGFYNEQEKFPVMTVENLYWRDNPIYHSTYTGKPPDEPAVLGESLNEVFVPLLQKAFPEIVDFYLPPEGCSYRLAVVSIKKQYPGHAKRIMMAVWSYLRQFMYTKFIIITDDTLNIRDWKEVIWALSTCVDPKRDTLTLENTPIDYLDFASPLPSLGSKLGIDATHKWPEETTRVWGRVIEPSSAVMDKINQVWHTLGL